MSTGVSGGCSSGSTSLLTRVLGGVIGVLGWASSVGSARVGSVGPLPAATCEGLGSNDSRPIAARVINAAAAVPATRVSAVRRRPSSRLASWRKPGMSLSVTRAATSRSSTRKMTSAWRCSSTLRTDASTARSVCVAGDHWSAWTRSRARCTAAGSDQRQATAGRAGAALGNSWVRFSNFARTIARRARGWSTTRTSDAMPRIASHQTMAAAPSGRCKMRAVAKPAPNANTVAPRCPIRFAAAAIPRFRVHRVVRLNIVISIPGSPRSLRDDANSVAARATQPSRG